MPASQLLDVYQPIAGFFDTDRHAVPENALTSGSFNVLLTGQNHQRVWKGLKSSGTGGRSMFKLIGGYASLNDYTSGMTSIQGLGSVFNFISKSMFFIGEGKVYYNGSALGGGTPFTATSNLQLSPSPYTSAYTAGLDQPDAPQVEARTIGGGDPFTGLLTGAYSFKIARVRSVTGGRSIASVTSAVITFSGQTCRMTFPALDSNGQDRWSIFGTKAGFGGTGVHYLVAEIADTDLSTIDGIPRSYQFEYADADLLPTVAFIDDYPPPAGSYGGRLESYVVVVGAYDNAIAVSQRNFPESFRPDDLGFLPGTPTSVLQDQMGSYLYVSTATSVHALSVAPSIDGNPLIVQTLWQDVGVAGDQNWCSVQGVIYAFVARQGAVTMDSQGLPSNQFAQPVAKAMQNWEPVDTVVVHIPDLNSVAYINGGKAYLFNYQSLVWCSPCQLNDFASGNAVSGVVVNRRLKLSMLNGSTFTLYDFDEQPTSGVTNFKIVGPDRKLTQGGRSNVLGIKGTFQAPAAGNYSLSAVADYGTRTKTLIHAAAAQGMQETTLSRWYLPRAEAARVEWSGSQSDFTKDCYLSGIETWGTHEMSRRITSS
jgi:hypothetical protein